MVRKKALAWSPIREIMKKVGANVVERKAVDRLISHLESVASEITASALRITRHGKRTKVSSEDIDLAIKMK